MTGTWTPPDGWDEPEVVVYRSFDTMDCMRLMEGTQESDSLVLVPGKVGHSHSIVRCCFFVSEFDVSLAILLYYSNVLTRLYGTSIVHNFFFS